MTTPGAPARSGRRFLVVAVACAAVAGAGGWLAGKFGWWGAPPLDEGAAKAQLARGERLYAVYCTSCHGPGGAGDGMSAANLRPPPRDFASRPWRFEPSAASIRRVVLEGSPGTAMSSFRHALAGADVDAVVAYVLHLSTPRAPAAAAPQPSPETLLVQEAGFIDLRGTSVPPLAISDAAGKPARLEDLKGRLVLVHFWGLSCAHCLKEMPALRRLADELRPRGLEVIHVCADADDLAGAQAAVDRVSPGVRVFGDDTGLALARFEAQALPTVWLIAPDGAPVGRSSGGRDWAAPSLRKLLDRWLPAAKP